MALIRVSSIAEPIGLTRLVALKVLKGAGVPIEQIGDPNSGRTHLGVSHLNVDRAEKLLKDFKETQLRYVGARGRPTNDRMDRDACAALREEIMPVLKQLVDLANAQGKALADLLAEFKK